MNNTFQSQVVGPSTLETSQNSPEANEKDMTLFQMSSLKQGKKGKEGKKKGRCLLYHFYLGKEIYFVLRSFYFF
jgi:hypothetical protein